MNGKVIVRLRGGLGNQLFAYAAGRSLAYRNDAELVLDTLSGFAFDSTYHRTFALGDLGLTGRPATPAERLEPFGYLRRSAARWFAKRQRFDRRRYVVEDHRGWEPKFLDLPSNGTLTLDGYWQSYRYFEGIGGLLRTDFGVQGSGEAIPATKTATVNPDHDATRTAPTVAVHYRWFGTQEPDSLDNLPLSYYQSAFERCEERLPTPRYVIFSDDARLASEKLSFLPADRTSMASAVGEDPTGASELRIMSRCQHFVIANSTFSWWGAWLGSDPQKMVIAPSPEQLHRESFWRAPGLLPTEWTSI